MQSHIHTTHAHLPFSFPPHGSRSTAEGESFSSLPLFHTSSVSPSLSVGPSPWFSASPCFAFAPMAAPMAGTVTPVQATRVFWVSSNGGLYSIMGNETINYSLLQGFNEGMWEYVNNLLPM